MKTLKYFFYVLLVSVLAFACDEREFDTPPLTAPVYTGPDANYSIKQLKNDYKDITSPTLIDKDYIVKAYVTANDESGNLYKQLVIQDEPVDANGQVIDADVRGIILSIDKSGLNSGFKVGQIVYVQLKDLYIGKYGGVPQLGMPGENGIGRMSVDEFEAHVFKHGLPSLEKATPVLLDNLKASKVDDNLSKLVTLENITFADGGKRVFAASTDGSAYDALAADMSGESITIRTSAYANFAGDTIPAGLVTITGIFSRYNNTWQFTLRSREDITSFKPLTVTEAIVKGKTDNKLWVKGFIVGTVAAGVNDTNPIDNSNDISLTPGDFMNNTLLIAASASETDYTKMMVVNLPANSAIRAALNLLDKPENLKKEVTVLGNLQLYFGALGVNIATGANGEFIFVSDEPLPEGNGSKENPYNVVQAQGKQGAAGNNAFLWVEGYVVGIWEGKDASGNDLYPNNFAKFEAPFYTDANIFLAASPTETNPAKMLNVQVSVAARDVLSPVKNGSIIGKKVAIRGSLEKYNTFNGLKNLQEYVLDGETPPTPPTPGAGDGTKEKPYDVAQIQGNQGAAGNNTFLWGEGYVVGIWEGKDASGGDLYPNNFAKFVAPFYTDANIFLAASPTETDPAKMVNIQLPTAMRDVLSPMKNASILGKKIAVKGSFEKYNTFNGIKNLQEYVADGVTPGPDPEPEPTDGYFFTETFGSGNYSAAADRKSIADFTDFDMKAPYVFIDASGKATVRSTGALNAHVWLPAYTAQYPDESQLKITGIATGYTGMELSYDIATNTSSTGDANKIIVKCNDVAVSVPSKTFTANNQFVTVTLTIPNNTTSIEFYSGSSNIEGYRLDNIKIKGSK
ncbi:DUF6359 domain-containing protein [Viscerimonas tarda]